MALTAALALTVSARAQAQPPPAGPSPAADPARVLRDSPPPMDAARPAAPGLIAPAPPSAAPGTGSDLRLIFAGGWLEGGILLWPEEVENALAPWKGRDITVAQLNDIAGELTAVYRRHGWLLAYVRVPDQTLRPGRPVRFEAVEGRVVEVEIEGGRGDEALIRRMAGRLVDRPALTLKEIEHAVLTVRDLEGVAATASLETLNRQGEVRLRLKVERDPGFAQVYLDNMNSPYQGPERGIATFQVNDLLGRSDYLRLSAQRALDPGELTSWSILQGVQLGPGGVRLELAHSDSLTRPGEDLTPYQLEGRARYDSLTFLFPIERSRYLNIRAHAGVSRVDSRQTVMSGAAELYHDRMTVISGGAIIDWQDPHFGGGLNTLRLEVRKGAGKDSLLPSRAGVQGDFAAFEVFVNRFQTLGPTTSLQVAAGGQSASGPLIAGEQFGLGAYPFGRGFDLSSLTGDRAAAAKIEIREDLTHRLGGPARPWLRQASLFAFHDQGRVWNYGADPEDLASTGLGLRAVIEPKPMALRDRRTLDVEAFLAWKTRAPAHLGDDSPVFKFRVIAGF